MTHALIVQSEITLARCHGCMALLCSRIGFDSVALAILGRRDHHMRIACAHWDFDHPTLDSDAKASR